jgi:hypothetical protein
MKFSDKQMANVSTHQLKPLELSAMDVGCSSDNKNGDGKPTTATISALRTNDSVITTTATNKTVYRLGHNLGIPRRLQQTRHRRLIRNNNRSFCCCYCYGRWII